MLTLPLPTRTANPVYAAVYCSLNLRCSDSLHCGETMAARFYWNF